MKTAPRVQEVNIIARAKKLKEEPSLIIPKCFGKCRKCGFEKLKLQLEKVYKHRDNNIKLSWFVNHGKRLARAYACSILVANAEKLHYLATARFGTDTIPYYIRGKARAKELIGVQYYDDQKLRLLAIAEIAARKKLHVYSCASGLVCTGKVPGIPKELVNQACSELGLKQVSDNKYACSHLITLSSETGLAITLKSADITLTICERCVSAQKNTFAVIAQYISAKNASDDFNIRLLYQPKCVSKCAKCVIREAAAEADDIIQDYFDAKLTDYTLLRSYTERVKSALSKLQQRLFIAADNCYGTDTISFVNALNPSSEERRGVEAMINNLRGPVLLNELSLHEFLTKYWSQAGKYALEAAAQDKEAAEELWQEHLSPRNLLRIAHRRAKEKELLASLPNYTALPEPAQFADSAAKMYKLKGVDRILKFIDSESKRKDFKVNSVAYAFLLAVAPEYAKNIEWRYSKVEKELAAFLKHYVDNLISASSYEDYHLALQSLLSAAGSTEKIQPSRA